MKILHDKMLEEIQKKQLNSAELSVFTPTGALGKKATKKERVKQAFYKEKLGMKLNEEEDAILHVRIEKPEDNPDTKEEHEEEDKEVDLVVELCPGLTTSQVVPGSENDSLLAGWTVVGKKPKQP